MSHSTFEGGISVPSSEALDRGDRVKLDAAFTVSKATALQASIGVVTEDVANGDLASVLLYAPDKVIELRALTAFAVGATLYGAADGEVDDVVNVGTDRYLALEAATAANDLVDCLPVFYGGA